MKHFDSWWFDMNNNCARIGFNNILNKMVDSTLLGKRLRIKKDQEAIIKLLFSKTVIMGEFGMNTNHKSCCMKY